MVIHFNKKLKSIVAVFVTFSIVIACIGISAGCSSKKNENNDTTATTTVAQVTTTSTTTTTAKPKDPYAGYKLIAFTFDDGPYSKVDKRLIKVFEKYNGKATFFVVGNRISTYKDTTKKLVEMGCEIGNHSYSHKYLNKTSEAEMKSEVLKCNEEIKKVLGVKAELMRPTGGFVTDKMKKDIQMPLILWSVDTNDWKKSHRSDYKKSVSAIQNNVQDGSIILMHDLYETSADTVEEIVPKLYKQGYRFVTVSELMKYRKINMKNGIEYMHAYKTDGVQKTTTKAATTTAKTTNAATVDNTAAATTAAKTSKAITKSTAKSK